MPGIDSAGAGATQSDYNAQVFTGGVSQGVTTSDVKSTHDAISKVIDRHERQNTMPAMSTHVQGRSGSSDYANRQARLVRDRDYSYQSVSSDNVPDSNSH